MPYTLPEIRIHDNAAVPWRKAFSEYYGGEDSVANARRGMRKMIARVIADYEYHETLKQIQAQSPNTPVEPEEPEA